MRNGRMLHKFEGVDINDCYQEAKTYIEKIRSIPEKIYTKDFGMLKKEEIGNLEKIIYYRNTPLYIFKQQDTYHGKILSEINIICKSSAYFDINDAIRELKNYVDDNPTILHEEFIQRHKRHLQRVGIRASGEITRNKHKRYRAAKCWACHHPIDNLTMYECSVCSGWIICTCGACGCGYNAPKY